MVSKTQGVDVGGSEAARLDAKSRLVIPACFRALFHEQVAHLWSEGAFCLKLGPSTVRARRANEIRQQAVGLEPGERRDRLEYLAEFTETRYVEISVDSQGRVVLPQLWRGLVNMANSSAVVVDGHGDHIAVWSDEAWQDSWKRVLK